MLTVLGALFVTAVLTVVFDRNERAGRPERIVLWLLGLLVVESTLYPSPFEVPTSLVHPQLGGTNFRLVDLVVLAALAVRLRHVGLPRSLRTTSLLWGTFLLWVVVEALLGVVNGGDIVLLLFEAKAVVYLSTMVLAGGVPAHRWRERAVLSFLISMGGLCAVLVVSAGVGASVDLPIPLLPIKGLGGMGSDGATVFATLGLLALGLALASRLRQVPLLLAAVSMLVTTVAAGQRAALIFAVVGAVVLVGTAVLSRHNLLAVTGVDVMLAIMLVTAVVIPFGVAVSVNGSRGLPFASTVSEVVDGRGKQLSAKGRLDQWRAVRPIIAARPLLGHGLGRTYQYYEPGPPASLVTSDVTHNVPGDLLLRTGLVGLLLFGAAMTSTVGDGFRAWRRATDRVLGVLALAATTAVIAWFCKGQVESLLEKYRLAVLLGLCVGMVHSLSSTRGDVNGAVDATTRPAPSRSHTLLR